MKKLTICLAIVISLIALPVYADGVYISLKGSIADVDIDGLEFSDPDDAATISITHDSSDNISSPGIAIGYDSGKARFEFEYFNRGTASYNGAANLGIVIADAQLDIETNTFFLNHYRDFTISKKFELYAGFGIGLAKHKSNIEATLPAGWIWIDTGTNTRSASDSDTELAYNYQIGAAYLVSDKITIDLGIRYAKLGEVDVDSFESVEIESKEVVLAFRYMF